MSNSIIMQSMHSSSKCIEVNLPWINNIPSDWKIIRGKNVLKPIDIRSETGNEELLTVSSINGVVPRKNANVTMFKAESYLGYKLCWPKDLVINSLWAWANGLGVSMYHGIISSAYGVYRVIDTNKLNPQYLHILVRSSPYQWELQVRSRGIWTSRLQLTDESFLDSPILIPSLEEQNAIVKFLDYIDKRIKQYIRAKQKLIKLLNEQKQAIIHQAVTRGIDPNVQFQPSRVDWLGNIPKHWEVRRLKTICTMKSGENITSLDIEPFGEYPVYGGNGLRGYSTHYTHDGDYVLIGRQGALCGNIHLVSGIFWASEHAIVTTLFEGNNIDWFAAILQIMNLNQYSISAAQPGLSVERILNLWLPFPTYEEQEEISSYIKEKCLILDRNINKEIEVIKLLKEYRTRIIADVVTGKLDVQEAAAQLLEELATEEHLDEEINDDEETTDLVEEGIIVEEG